MKKLLILLILFGVASANLVPILSYNALNNTLRISVGLPSNQVLTYNQIFMLQSNSITMTNVILSNVVGTSIINASSTDGAFQLTAPPDNFIRWNTNVLLGNNAMVSNALFNATFRTLPGPAHQVVTVTNGGGTLNVNNVTIDSPPSVNLIKIFPSSNQTQFYSTTPVTNVSFSVRANGYTMINNAINLTGGSCWRNATYNSVVCATQLKLNVIQNASCSSSFITVLNNPQTNTFIGVKPCPKWNLNRTIVPSYNSPTIITNSSLNASITVNAIPTILTIVNMSVVPLGTVNSLGAGTSNLSIGWYDSLRKIYIGYPNFRVNRTLLPGSRYTNPLVGVQTGSLNWSSLAFDWPILVQQYEKNVVPKCQKNATWTEGNYTYCARLNNTDDIRTLCSLQQILDHNLTEVMPNCVLNAVKFANLKNNATYTALLAAQGENHNLTQQLKFYQEGGGLIDLFIVVVAGVIVIALALSAYSKVTGWRPFHRP